MSNNGSGVPRKNHEKPLVIVTGGSGMIGSRLVRQTAPEYRFVVLDVEEPPQPAAHAAFVKCDMTDDQSTAAALEQIRREYGGHVASVVHLAAYYDFSGDPSPLYDKLTVQGTRRLLRGLHDFDKVEQFIFTSTLLVMKPAEDDFPLDETSPTQAEWDYPQSKLDTEDVIKSDRKQIPAVVLRLAGIYDDAGHSIPICQQISRIYEEQLESHVFPGDTSRGQSFVHLDDAVECIRQAIDRRDPLEPHEMFLIGEEDVMSYAELQQRIGELIHGERWSTIRVPKAVAKAGAWVQEKMAGSEEEEPFIKPWMVDLADQHYPVNIARARARLEWSPERTLRGTLPVIIQKLKENPRAWYEENGIPWPDDDDS